MKSFYEITKENINEYTQYNKTYFTIDEVSSYIFSYEYNKENESFSYSYLYKQTISNIEKTQNKNSYISYLVDLSTINVDASYFENIVDKNVIDNNLLVLSMLDEKMYYNTNLDIPKYQYNNIIFINNEKDIIPLTYNIKNIDSSLTLTNDEINIKIDNNTIKEDNKKLISDYTLLNKSTNNTPGLFKIDNDTLIIENDTISLSYTIQDTINDIDDHIDIMSNIINQTSYNLTNVIGTFKEYMLYDKRYSCNTNIKYPIYYSNNVKNDILMKETIERDNEQNISDHYYLYYIDYDQKFFDLKIKFVYNYLSPNLMNFNPFNEKYLNIEISIEGNENDDPKLTQVKNCIKFNINKSYIYNSGVYDFNEESNNVYGHINYICHFSIDNNSLYKIKDLNDKYIITINIYYNDTYIKSESSTKVKLILFIDNTKNTIFNKILYHNYDVGFNYDGIGNQIGICFYNSQNQKPIFLRYANDGKDLIHNHISNNIFEKYYNDINDTPGLTSVSRNLNNINSNNIIEGFYLYKDKDFKYNSDINIINIKNKYKDYLKYCFNETYNICGYGLRHGDCYPPSYNELAIIVKYGFDYYIINDFDYLMSSSISKEENNIRIFGLSKTTNNYGRLSLKVGETIVDFDGNYHDFTNSSININNLKWLSVFKLPDFSILNGDNYYLSYDKESNYEIVDYSTKSIVKIRIKCYNSQFNLKSLNNRFYIYCKDKNVTYSKIDIEEISKDIYELSFIINTYIDYYNNFDIYYYDSDPSFNTDLFNNVKYRRLCRISVKID